MSKTRWWIVVAVTGLVAACSANDDSRSPSGTTTSEEAPAELRASPVLGLQLWQGGELSPMNLQQAGGRDVVLTDLEAAPFEVRLPKRKSDVAVQLCAWTDASLFTLEPGMKEVDIPYFMPGTGYADERSGRMTLFVGKDGHNHLVQERVASHSGEQEQILFGAIVSTEGNEEFFTGDVFVVAFIDVNENETVDAGEFEYLHIMSAV